MTQGVRWSDRVHGTGIDELDRQHQELIRRINLLLDALEHESAKLEVENMLQFLRRYMNSHFHCEEVQMAQRRCVGCAANLEQHQHLAQEIQAIQHQHAYSGTTPELAKRLRQLLVRWVEQHIPRVDGLLRASSPGRLPQERLPPTS